MHVNGNDIGQRDYTRPETLKKRVNLNVSSCGQLFQPCWTHQHSTANNQDQIPTENTKLGKIITLVGIHWKNKHIIS